jgi:hypothetical protein
MWAIFEKWEWAVARLTTAPPPDGLKSDLLSLTKAVGY